MNKKIWLVGLAVCATASTAIAIGVTNNGFASTYAGKASTESSIKFETSEAVISDAGNTFTIDAKPGSEHYVTMYTEGKICDMERNAILYVNSSATNGFAQFAYVSSIDVWYKAEGTSTDALQIWLGDVTVGDFSRALKAYPYLPGTEGLWSTYTYTVPENIRNGVLVGLYANVDNIELAGFRINYTC